MNTHIKSFMTHSFSHTNHSGFCRHTHTHTHLSWLDQKELHDTFIKDLWEKGREAPRPDVFTVSDLIAFPDLNDQGQQVGGKGSYAPIGHPDVHFTYRIVFLASISSLIGAFFHITVVFVLSFTQKDPSHTQQPIR